MGGTIIAGFDKSFISKVSQCYPGISDASDSCDFKLRIKYLFLGRASSSPIIDLFITLLSLGSKKYITLVRERKQLYQELKDGLSKVASRFGQRILDTPGNSISIGRLGQSYMKLKFVLISNACFFSRSEGITLPSMTDQKLLTQLGSQLFLRCVSGTRVVSNLDQKVINGYEFRGWGSHHNSYPTSYLTAAATIGMTAVDVEQFLHRLTRVMESWSAKSVPNDFLTNGHDVFAHESQIDDNLFDQESSVI